MAYSVIIPIYNEVRTLPKLITQLKSIEYYAEIIIIDDGSNDGSEEILENNRNKNLLVFKTGKNLGKGAAIKIGILHSSNEHIILADGDLEIDIEEIPSLIEKYEKSKKNILTGVRTPDDNHNRFGIDRFGNYIINIIFNKIYSTNLKDILCCIKIINKNLIKSLDIKSNGFGIEVEIMAKLVLKKITIEEARINYNRRTIDEGKKLKISDGWNIIWIIFKLKVKSLFV